MAIYELKKDAIVPVAQTTFAIHGIQERRDVQRLLRECIEIISPDTMILAEEFGQWVDSNRRIDLLGLDRDAKLVVMELKRSEDGGHMELQSLRYAAMVSTMTFEQAVEAHRTYLSARGLTADPAESIRAFLDVDEPIEFSDVRIVLAAADFSKEITSSVMWLNDHGTDIRCVRLRPYEFDGKVLLDVQQVIPLPEAAEFQIAIQQKSIERRAVERAGKDLTKYWLKTQASDFPRLNKRNFIYQVVKEAIRLGCNPDQIDSSITWRHSGLFVSVPGRVEGPAFRTMIEAEGESVRRQFCEDDELFFFDNKTYAMTNQWGLKTEDAVKCVIRILPEGHGITFGVASEA